MLLQAFEAEFATGRANIESDKRINPNVAVSGLGPLRIDENRGHRLDTIYAFRNMYRRHRAGADNA